MLRQSVIDSVPVTACTYVITCTSPSVAGLYVSMNMAGSCTHFHVIECIVCFIVPIQPLAATF